MVLPLARAAAVSTGLRLRPNKLAPRRRAHVEQGRHWSGSGLGLGLGLGLGFIRASVTLAGRRRKDVKRSIAREGASLFGRCTSLGLGVGVGLGVRLGVGLGVIVVRPMHLGHR